MTFRSKVSPRYLLSCALSLLGNSVAGVILPLVLLATTGDALAAGTLALICALPQMLIGLVGGALIDRLNRRDVSIASDVLSAASVALLPVVDMTVGLDFGWFVALGLLGAVGDIPGMTARDALLPAVCDHDYRSLQKFMGMSQSVESLTAIAGPALAAFLLTLTGGVSALWLTAALSLAAALVTLTLPRSIGRVGDGAAAPAGGRGGIASGAVAALRDGMRVPAPAGGRGGIASGAVAALRDGMRVLFRDDALLRSSTLLTFGIIMVMGSFQGLVLPVHFTAAGTPELLGFVLSALSAGMLVSSLAYSALAHRLRRRTWLIASLSGIAVGVAVLGSLASFPVMLAGALAVGLSAGPASALLGFFAFDRSSLAYSALAHRLRRRTWLIASLSGIAVGVAVLGSLASFPVMLAGALAVGLSAGPASALLGFFAFDRIPADRRGAALGTQNSLTLAAAPAAVFASSAVTEAGGAPLAALVLVGCWLAVTLWALATPSLRHLDGEGDGAPAAGRRERERAAAGRREPEGAL